MFNILHAGLQLLILVGLNAFYGDDCGRVGDAYIWINLALFGVLPLVALAWIHGTRKRPQSAEIDAKESDDERTPWSDHIHIARWYGGRIPAPESRGLASDIQHPPTPEPKPILPSSNLVDEDDDERPAS